MIPCPPTNLSVVKFKGSHLSSFCLIDKLLGGISVAKVTTEKGSSLIASPEYNIEMSEAILRQ